MKDSKSDSHDASSWSFVDDGFSPPTDISHAQLQSLDPGLLTFPEKLMSLLDGDCVSDVMWWLPDGDAFCFIPDVFAEEVLDKHFQGTKFESFTRKLNRWGFKRVAGQKVPARTVAYYHNSFTRGHPDLIKEMTGGKAKGASSSEKKVRPRSDSIRSSPKQQSKLRGTTRACANVSPSLTSDYRISDIAACARNVNVHTASLDYGALSREGLDASINAELGLRFLRDTGHSVAETNDLAKSLLLANSVESINNSVGSGLANQGRMVDTSVSSNASIAHLLRNLVDQQCGQFHSGATSFAGLNGFGSSDHHNFGSNLVSNLAARNLVQSGNLNSSNESMSHLLAQILRANQLANLNEGSGGGGSALSNTSNEDVISRLLFAQQAGALDRFNPSLDAAMIVASSASAGVNMTDQAGAGDFIRRFLTEQHR